MITHSYSILTLISIITVLGGLHAGQIDGSYRYMVELYNWHKNEQTNRSTTVRSILASIGKTEIGEMLIYNLTSVSRTEVIVKAELHIYTRKKSKTSENFLNLWDPTSLLSLPLEERRIGSEVGWSVHNVTEPVLKTRKVGNQNLLGVSLKGRNYGRRLRPLPMRKLIGPNTQSFLVVFSEDKLTRPNTTEAFQSQLEDIVNLVNSRRKRSLHENGPPEYHSHQFGGMPTTLTSSSHRKPYGPPQEGEGTGSKKQGDKTDKGRPFLRSRGSSPYGNDATITEYEVGIGSCRKREFVVQMDDIGWSDIVVAPKKIALGYCSGQCLLGAKRNTSWSNHATVRNLVHILKLDPDVPPAYCVPDVTSALSLLYIDDKDSVVLKDYTNMVVESCACQ